MVLRRAPNDSDADESGHLAPVLTASAAVPLRPLLSGLYHVVPLGPDRVQVCNAGRSVVVTGTGFGESLPPLLASLDGTRSAKELESSFPNVVPVLRGLASRGLVIDGGDGGSAPMPAATAIVDAPPPEETALRLSGATVALAGTGAVALTAAVSLAKAGVGRITVDDSRVVTPDDVDASPVLHPDAAGRTVREALGNATLGVARTVVAQTSDVVAPDLVIVEQLYTKTGLHPPAADAALAVGAPYIVHGQDALQATVGPLVQRGGRPCHRCAETRRHGNVAHIDEHLAYLAHRAGVAPGPTALLAAQTSIVAGYLSLAVLRALLTATPTKDATVLVIDLASGAARREPLLQVPLCDGCLTAEA